MTSRVMLIVLLSGCTTLQPGAPPSAHDQALASVTISGWQSRGLPVSEDQVSWITEYFVLDADTPSTLEYWCASRQVHACMLPYTDGPTVVVGPDHDRLTREHLIVHELLHALVYQVAGHVPVSDADIFDSQHLRREVWKQPDYSSAEDLALSDWHDWLAVEGD